MSGKYNYKPKTITQDERDLWRRVFGMLPYEAFAGILSEEEQQKVREIRASRGGKLSTQRIAPDCSGAQASGSQ